MLGTLAAAARSRLGGTPKALLRTAADWLLYPIGSINGAEHPRPEVALTFDDGPDPEVTPRLLDRLAEREVRATFFVLTERMRQEPWIVARMVREGHEVGLHFDRHEAITTLHPAEARARIAAARDEVQAVAGPIIWFRPPFGLQSLATYRIARSLGLEVVVWGPYARDWEEQPPASAAAHAMINLQAGDILLLHDGAEMPDGESRPTFDKIEMVDLILDKLEAMGLSGVNVGALLAGRRTRRTAWFRS
jgi:peptidoglycan/xylan/chitin deacetylase (PgdA/CDA1 family)